MQTIDGEIQLIDFGLVHVYCDKHEKQLSGTLVYAGSEYFSEENMVDNPQWIKLMPAHDIWSTIVTCYELLLGYLIFHHIEDARFRPEEIIKNISILLGNPGEINETVEDYSGHSFLAIEKPKLKPNPFFTIPKLFDLIDDPDLIAILRRCTDPNPFTRATSAEILQSPYAQRYLRFAPETLTPCQHRAIIDGNPFAGYRTKEERENWIAFCEHFEVIGVQYAPMFECVRLPKTLYYMDYFAILSVIKKVEFRFVSLPHSIPVSNGVSVNLKSLIKKYTKSLLSVAKLQLFDDHRRHQEIVKIVTRGYLDGKCSTMSVLELLAE